MIKLEEILKNITSDLKLSVSEQIEFENQFMQLFIFNLLLNVPDQYKDGIEKLTGQSDLKDQAQLVEEITSLGITKEDANSFLNNSIKKSISDIIGKYDDVLSSATKEKLQNYI